MFGLLDFFGGSSGDNAADLRLERTPEGERWWKIFDQLYGEQGPVNPVSSMTKAVSGMDQAMGFQLAPVGVGPGGAPVMKLVSKTLQDAPLTVTAGGITRKVTPQWARQLPFQYTSSMSSLMQPWVNAGMLQEQQRLGSMPRGNSGDGFGGMLAKGMGGALVGGLFDLL